jgi:HSP20 family protein
MQRSRSRQTLYQHVRRSDPSNQGTQIFASTVHVFSNVTRGIVEYRLDLHEDAEKNLVTATFEFPGVSKDDVQLNLQNGKLTVSAETNKSEEHAETGYTLRERIYGKLSRTIQLPQDVQVRHSSLNILGRMLGANYLTQEEQIKATLANGILTVKFPKSLPEVAPKKITISDA